MNIAIIGAGLTGSSAARKLAEAGHKVTVFEKEFGQYCGSCADIPVASRMGLQSVYMSKYGPHVFHTNEGGVISFVKQFSPFFPYDHKVVAMTTKGVLPWPINNVSLCRAFDANSLMEAKKGWAEDIDVTKKIVESANEPENFETIAMKTIGSVLYNTFIKGYTETQWRCKASELPAELFGRIRVSGSNENHFFDDKFVGLPMYGYSELGRSMLEHKNIKVFWQEVTYKDLLKLVYGFDNVINTAPTHDLLENAPRLPFNRVKFLYSQGVDLTPFKTPVVNINKGGKYTRMTDYWAMYTGKFDKNFVGIEEPSDEGAPLYTIRTIKNVTEYERQKATLAKLGVVCAGRMGSYSYLNMDQAVLHGFAAASKVMKGA